MPKLDKLFLLTTYFACQKCNRPCVVSERFNQHMEDDDLQQVAYTAKCSHCDAVQTFIGKQAIERRRVEWTLEYANRTTLAELKRHRSRD